MTRLKNRNEFIPGGFQFVQPQSGWQAPLNASFDTVARAVMAHRKGNPHMTAQHKLATDYETVAIEVETYNVKRMQANPQWHHFLLEGGDSSSFPKWMPLPEQAGKPANVVAGAANKTVAGIKTLIDWLGEGGKPVPANVAEARAAVCAGCPKNQPGNWKTFFTELAVQEISKVFGIMNDLDLKTSMDDKLGVCQACLCPLRSKVHAPIDHIIKNMPEKVKNELHPMCWVLYQG